MRDAKTAGVPIFGLSNAAFEQSNALADSLYSFYNLDPTPDKNHDALKPRGNAHQR
jgi:hypothetical protein